ncbi:lactonase family protein [Kribbella sp. NPDC023972]|uniref:lactonase family protein n=1 Tax=Kribbella sp. NPDC023972 TaxID=3154795 RepID=UPI0033CC0108
MTVTRRGFLGITAATLATTSAATSPAAASPVATRSAAPPGGGTPSRTLYLGTYTSSPGGGSGIGIATYEANGKISATGVLSGVEDPSFLVTRGRHLYAVNEQRAGGVTAIAIDAPGKLRILNRQPNQGSAPCHLTIAGDYLLSANYGSGDLAVHPIRSDGSLGQQTDLVKHKGTTPHAHQVLQAGKYVLAVDLGTDSIYTYTLADGKLLLRHQTTLKTGAGPRHLAFHPSGRYAYVANELDSTITVCRYDNGRLTPTNTVSTIPPGSPQNYPGEVITSPDGRFVYLTNRGHNSIAVFATSAAGSALSLVSTPSCGGDWPRHCALDPSGRLMFVSNQRSNNVTTFAVAHRTGGLTQTSSFSIPTPVCVSV